MKLRWDKKIPASKIRLKKFSLAMISISGFENDTLIIWTITSVAFSNQLMEIITDALHTWVREWNTIAMNHNWS